MFSYPFLPAEGKESDESQPKCLDESLNLSLDRKWKVLRNICPTTKNFDDLPFKPVSSEGKPKPEEVENCWAVKDVNAKLEKNSGEFYSERYDALHERFRNEFPSKREVLAEDIVKCDGQGDCEQIYDSGRDSLETSTYSSDYPSKSATKSCNLKPRSNLTISNNLCPLEKYSVTKADFRFNLEDYKRKQSKYADLNKGNLTKLDQEFAKDTIYNTNFGKKTAEKNYPIKHPTNLTLSQENMQFETENLAQFTQKSTEKPCYPIWAKGSHEKCTLPMEDLTTYNDYYFPHEIQDYSIPCQMESPSAEPFCTLTDLYYSGTDPVFCSPNASEEDICTRTKKCELSPCEIQPWVKREPIIQPENLKINSCAPFRDDTTYDTDYNGCTLSGHCYKSKSFAPVRGYVPPNRPFVSSGDTINRSSFRPYAKEEMCDKATLVQIDPKCQTPPPYDTPELEDPSEENCPCICLDGRTSYRSDFQLWSPGQVPRKNKLEGGDFEKPQNIPKGNSLYRLSYPPPPDGKKASIIPPLESKSHRAINPSGYRLKNSIYQNEFRNYWKEMDKEFLNVYLAKPCYHSSEDNCQKEEDGDAK